MRKIYIRTIAYNAEKTIRRTLDSVVNQTYKNFIYYICDNGSTDSTGAIIDEYAKKDRRFRVYRNEANRVWNEDSKALRDLPLNLNDNDLYCALDADDTYHIDFLKIAISTLDANGVDIVAVGSNHLDAESSELRMIRSLDNPLFIVDNHCRALYFPYYHQFMRTIWGKLYTGKTSKNFVIYGQYQGEYPLAYGGDTFNTMRAFSVADKFIVLDKILHDYYVSKGSVSYTFQNGREDADRILQQTAEDFLLGFSDEISDQNQEFLSLIYSKAISGVLSLLLTKEFGFQPSEILDKVYSILANDVAKRYIPLIYRYDYLKELQEFFPLLTSLVGKVALADSSLYQKFYILYLILFQREDEQQSQLNFKQILQVFSQ